MKKPYLNILFLFLLFAALVSNAQVGINTTTPNAQLEIKSSNQANPTNSDGLIIPKIDTFPSTNPTSAQQGMMVYLTTTSGLNSPGFYYWDNNALPSPKWVAIGSGSSSSSSFTHYIGELYGGGIVVAVWKEGGVEKGLIASLTNMVIPTAFPDLIPWTSVSFQCTSVPSSAATSPVDGQANTNAIIAQNGNAANTAATVCDQYSNAGFSDWYLPSIFELDQCYNAALIVNRVLGNINGFQTTTKYWSSTEINPCSVYAKYFDLGYTTTNTKGFTNLVRAVRKF